MKIKLLAVSAALVGGAVWWNRMKLVNSVRGLRNNNPLNIRENSRVDYDWEGEAIIDNDQSFEVFTDPRYGYRAAARILASYKRRSLVTLEQIITAWAPEVGDDGSHENDTESYIRSVEASTGIDRGETVTVSDYPRLFAAMTRHENGVNPYSVEFIAEGVSWA